MRISAKRIWTFSLVVYIICSTAFSYGDLRRLNTLALYFFLGISVLNILEMKKIRLNVAAAAIILYLVLSLFGMVYTPTASSKVWEVIYDCITMSVLALCVIQYIQTKEDIHIILHAYMVAGFVLALYVYAQYGSSFWKIMMTSVGSVNGKVTRLGKELANVNTISLSAAISAVIAVYYCLYSRVSKCKKIACVLIAVFSFLVSMAAASKKSLILIFVCIFAIWMYNMIGNHNFIKKFRNIIGMLIAVVLLLWMINTLPIFSGIAKRFDQLLGFLEGEKGGISERDRTYLMTEGFKIWTDHMIFGAGTASTTYYFGVYSHNNLLELLINSGLIGFTVFYSVYLYAAYQYLKKAVRYRTMDNLTVLLFALFLSITVVGFAMVYYYDRYYMFLMTTIFSAIPVYNAELQKKTIR